MTGPKVRRPDGPVVDVIGWWKSALDELEAELLEAYYEDDPRDFDNVLRQIFNARRKGLDA